ncbi:tail protein X [Vibrio cholerae]|uniref:tail protein X n=1 Tax=Vibrio cholerae TaxID=666 RepID=UPI000B974673|nr:tail protein X [Vibrio cholerae]EGQ9962126.1 phage tail protein [Vibrio cholerae]EGQ9983347.1 phage tail protein [Vibrio cholerae]EGR1084636.1 phage tail protein [Vibrio cholerae]EGR4228752.1 phage tail protein [Vibrio cholerae]EHD7114706.1 phage tail protein [Vibrio cholerae]
MATTYRTREGDVLDRICWRHYGRENAAVEVMKANPGLADYGAVLPSGLQITLPDIAPESKPEANALWD